jgi:ABC-type amino acid transport substrate-binding protein
VKSAAWWFLLLPFSVLAETEKPILEWCLDHFPPRQFFNAGATEPTGPMVTMMRELADRSGFSLTFSMPTPSNRCMKQLAEGTADIMTGVVGTAEREKHLLLAPFDIARLETWFVRRSQQQKGMQGIQRIALLKDRPYREALTTELQQQGFNLSWLNNAEHALAALFLKDVDAVIGPEHTLSYAISSQPRYGKKLVLLNSPQNNNQQHANLAMSRTGPHAALFERISTELTRMAAEGKTQFYHTADQH